MKSLIRASDAKSWDHCLRRVWFDNNLPDGCEVTEPNPFDQLILDLGIQHELAIKQKLEEKYEVIEAKTPEHTKELMSSGLEVIYQGQFIKDDIIGKPDFLIRHETGSYQAADAKLAHSDDKKEIQIQLGIYRRLLQNDLPALVYLGTGEITEIGDEANKVVDKYLASMHEILAQPMPPPVRFSESKCKECNYMGICKPQFEAKGEITLLYGIESRAAPGLEQQGIVNIKKLSETDPTIIQDVPYLKGFEAKQRAVLQAKAYLNDEFYQLKPIQLPTGTYVHFDIEDNPLTSSGNKHVYLWGFLKPNYSKADFEYVWTDGESQDREGWDRFLVKVDNYKKQFPDLKLVHFSNHEKATIETYSKRYEMQDHPTVSWLLGDDSPLFDIQQPVKECLVLPLAGYGLKYVCKHPKLVNFQWEDSDSGSQWSVVQYANYLMCQTTSDRDIIKHSILGYNLDDVMATRMLELWLRSLIEKQ
jgi:uncharacterized protein